MPAATAAVVTFFKWLGVDMASDVVWKGVKEASKAMVDAFSKETGKTISTKGLDALWEAVPRLLPATEDDEIMIREALKLIPDRDVQEAWFDIVNSFDDPADAENGRLRKEYYRRYVVGDSPHSTAATITNHAGMSVPLLNKFKDAMDINFKADQKTVAHFKEFMDWSKTKGANFWTALSIRRAELDSKFGTTAADINTWRANRRVNRGQP